MFSISERIKSYDAKGTTGTVYNISLDGCINPSVFDLHNDEYVAELKKTLCAKIDAYVSRKRSEIIRY